MSLFSRIVSVLCLSLAVTLSAQEISVAKRGDAPTCTIVRPANASPSQFHAASDLQRFTEQMTGVKLPIITDDEPLPASAILIGDTKHSTGVLGSPLDLDSLGNDGFRLVSRPPHLLIIGGSVRGSLYGVYEILEQFGGCRWYTSWHSVIPKLDEWRIPSIDQTQKPAFVLREPYWFDMLDGDLAARNKVNGSAMRLEEKHGGKTRFGQGMFVHTFEKLCPPDEFFETHPEYFSEIDGHRLKEHSQLCLTNPDVLKIVTERLLERIRKDPTAKLFSVSQNDWRNPCTCPQCKAIDDREESHAGTMIAFVNQVAAAVEKEFPDVWIETLAYQYTRKPPKTVRPRHNVVPRLCTIECDFSQSLEASLYVENQKFVDEIRAWSAMTDKLYVWDYTTNFRHYLGPFPNVLSLQDNVKLFRANHVVGLFEQGAYQGRHADFAELKAWLLAKWLWNPDLPLEPLLDDFFKGYYGAAAPLVRRYFDEVHTFHKDRANHPMTFNDNMANSGIPDGFFERSRKLWEEAEALVKDSPAHSYNVRMGAIPVLYARLLRMPVSEEIKIWVTENPLQYQPSAETRALAAELLARYHEAKDIVIAENGTIASDMLAKWQSLAEPPEVLPARKATLEDSAMSLGKRGEWGDTVADPLAEDGSAMKIYNTHQEWCTQLQFKNVAFDPGRTYRIRIRARVEKKPDTEGSAFQFGIYDTAGKKGIASYHIPTSEAGAEYKWYEVADWKPEKDHFLWIAPGQFAAGEGGVSAIKAVFIDKLELMRAD